MKLVNPRQCGYCKLLNTDGKNSYRDSCMINIPLEVVIVTRDYSYSKPCFKCPKCKTNKQAMDVLDEIRRAKPEDRLIRSEEDVINLFACIID